jgi:hypothetical protein
MSGKPYHHRLVSLDEHIILAGLRLLGSFWFWGVAFKGVATIGQETGDWYTTQHSRSIGVPLPREALQQRGQIEFYSITN